MIIAILALAALLRIIYLSFPSLVWWDASIYVGMGKFMYTHGAIGFWEMIRPLLWPAILGTFWKIGLNPLTIGTVLVFLSSLGAIYISYRIGETLMPRAGLFAATLLSFTGIYFFFTNVQITDIPSVFIVLIATWFALNKRYYLAGLFVGIVFTMRFPQAIYLGVFGLTIIICNSKQIKKTILEGLNLCLGFATLALPYLALNYKLYGSALLPIVSGNNVFLASVGQSNSLWYYPWNLFLQNPFLIAGVFACGYWIYHYRATFKDNVRVVTLLSIVIVGGYFMALDHKELRYSIAFLPFITIASGYGLSFITRNLSTKITNVIIAVLALILICGGLYVAVPSWKGYMSNPPLTAFYTFFTEHPGSKVVATSPQIVANADVKLVEVIGTWEDAANAIPRMNGNVDYVGVDTCQIGCNGGVSSPQCIAAEQTTRAMLQSLQPVFATSSQSCSFTVYKYK